MSILVDTVEDELADLNQGIESAPKPQKTEDKGVTATAAADFEMPDKLKGKTAEEIAAIYVAEQGYVGELKNQLGDYRSMTDRFLSIEEKRVEDLETAVEEIDIDPTELLANPGKVLDEYYDKRRGSDPAYTQLQERLDRIEGQVGQSAIQQKHPDTLDVVADPKFQGWVNENTFRARIAQQAVANSDVEALDYLLTEWKAGRTASNAEPEADTRQQSEVERARSVVTESSSSGNASAKSEKRFSRRKLVDLRVKNPEEYTARAEEILLAYAQGRVDD